MWPHMPQRRGKKSFGEFAGPLLLWIKREKGKEKKNTKEENRNTQSSMHCCQVFWTLSTESLLSQST